MSLPGSLSQRCDASTPRACLTREFQPRPLRLYVCVYIYIYIYIRTYIYIYIYTYICICESGMVSLCRGASYLSCVIPESISCVGVLRLGVVRTSWTFIDNLDHVALHLSGSTCT